jgi:exodeoxyribonuclease VII large subunit
MAQLVLGDEPTRSIAQLYGEVTTHLDARFGRAHQVWVAGEIQKLSDHRSGHGYLDLVDHRTGARDVPTLKAKCWRTTWGPIKASLRKAGLTLEEGMVVRVRGYVDVYAARGELAFVVTAIDLDALGAAMVGRHAQRRARLLAALQHEGLLEKNRALPEAPVPLSVGLVASKGTEGYHDFVGMLESSGFGFRVTLARAAVQGPTAPLDVAAGVRALGRSGCDVVCVVRGGGAQGDLAAFDDERVARAIATCPVPVRTGIGHTGDVSVADLVAHDACRTPTACAEGLVSAVRGWYDEHVVGQAARVGDAAADLLDERADEVDQLRRHLGVVGTHHLARAQDGLRGRGRAVDRAIPAALARSGEVHRARADRLAVRAAARVADAHARLAARRALLAAYDPQRLLARGWSITTDADGTVLRSVDGLAAGATLTTRLADGVARSTVVDVTEEGS